MLLIGAMNVLEFIKKTSQLFLLSSFCEPLTLIMYIKLINQSSSYVSCFIADVYD